MCAFVAWNLPSPPSDLPGLCSDASDDRALARRPSAGSEVFPPFYFLYPDEVGPKRPLRLATTLTGSSAHRPRLHPHVPRRILIASAKGEEQSDSHDSSSSAFRGFGGGRPVPPKRDMSEKDAVIHTLGVVRLAECRVRVIHTRAIIPKSARFAVSPLALSSTARLRSSLAAGRSVRRPQVAGDERCDRERPSRRGRIIPGGGGGRMAPPG